MSSDGWLRLDARMLAVAPAQEVLRFVPLLVIAVVAGGRENRQWWLLGVLGAVAGIGVLRWFTTRYRVTPQRMELRSGLLFRQHRSVPRDRIRTVDVTARLLHRIFGLTVLRIGTGQHGSGGDRELALDAVSSAEAERLRAVLLDRSPVVTAQPSPGHLAPHADALIEPAGPTPVGEAAAAGVAAPAGGTAPPVQAAPAAAAPGEPAVEPVALPAAVASTELARLSWAWLRFAPLTVLAVASVGALFGGAWQVLNEAGVELTDIGTIRSVRDWLTRQPIEIAAPAAVGFLLVVGAAGALALYVEAWWGYRLTRQGDGSLRVSRGLLTKRSVSLEERRLRGVELDEPLLLRAGRGARLNALATGTGGGDRSALLPPAPRAEAHRVAAAVLRQPRPPTVHQLRRHPPAALRRRLFRAVLPAAILVAGLLVAAAAVERLPYWPALVAAVVLLPASVLLGIDRYRNLGHALTDDYLIVRSGSLVRESVALRRSGIIGWRVSQSVFQRAAGLVTATAVTAAGRGGYGVLDCDMATAAELVSRNQG